MNLLSRSIGVTFIITTIILSIWITNQGCNGADQNEVGAEAGPEEVKSVVDATEEKAEIDLGAEKSEVVRDANPDPARKRPAGLRPTSPSKRPASSRTAANGFPPEPGDDRDIF